MNSKVIYKIKNGVAQIILNRPEAYNSFNRQLAAEFLEALKEADENEKVRALLITGNGKGFSAGQDLKEVLSENRPSHEEIIYKGYNPTIKLMRNTEKPIVVAVNGIAAGAGASIALAGDIIIASENATFIQAFSKIGLVPDSGGTYFLPRAIGYQKALALTMLGEPVSAKEAERLGMIYSYYPAEELKEKAIQLAEHLAQMPTKALGKTKKIYQQSYQNSLDEQLDLEGQTQIELANSHDAQEGVKAFAEKRPPKFKGE